MIDAAAPFSPTQVSPFADLAAQGIVAKITTDGTSLFVTRADMDSIVKYSVPSGAMSTFAMGLDTPGGLAVTGGYMYISERGANRIVRASLANGQVEAFAGSGGSGSLDGSGATATFNTPRGLATDGTYIYVADRGTSCLVRRISIATRDVDTIAGTPGGGNCALVDGPRATARMSAPGGLVVVGARLYVTDTPAIRVIDLVTLDVSTLAGTAQTGFVDGPPASARFSTSIAEMAERNGVLYVADSYNHRVRMISTTSGSVATLAGNGTDDDTPGTLDMAELHEPDGLVFLGAALYVASDLSIHRID